MFKKLILLWLCPLGVYGQNTIGLPDVVNYSKQVYSAGLQNWDIKQDRNGIIYLANNEGLLSFDGKNWNLYPLPNKTVVRSVEMGKDGRIYAGGQDELGYFKPGPNGRLYYHPLTALIPQQDKSFGDVWDICAHNNDLFVRTATRIFKFTNGSVTTFMAPGEWTYLGVCNGQVYAHDYQSGLLRYENGVWLPVSATNTLPPNDPVTGMLSIAPDSTLVTTLKNGLLLLSKAGLTKIPSPNNVRFASERIYAATTVNKDWIALATSSNGVYITDHQGNIIQSFAGREGLQNNNVLCILLDKQQNLWLGLNNGIDMVSYNSAIKQINPFLQDGSGYAAIIFDNRLYIGTSNGLYSVALQATSDLSFSRGDFIPVGNTQGQTWNLSQINDQLLLGHHEGAFVVRNNTAEPIAGGTGFWNFTPLSAIFPVSGMLAGNYKGLTFFDCRNQRFTQINNLSGFTESSRFVVMDKEQHIWVSHPYHGVFRLSANGDGTYTTRLFSEKDGLPATLNHHIYQIQQEVLAATEKGVYRYLPATNRFEPAAFYTRLLGDQSVRYMKEDKSGNIWFIHEKKLGVIDLSGKEPVVIYLPELNNKILSGFECIYPVDDNNIFLGAEKGFFHINYAKYKQNLPDLQVQIRNVHIISKTDSLLFGGYFTAAHEKQVQDARQVPEIQARWKTIRFEFSSAQFTNQANLEYSYRLKGFDDNWSEWNKRSEKEYTNLPPGSFTFEVKVRSNFGTESAPHAYTFRVLPPWYRTIWANIFYLLLFAFAAWAIYRWQKLKFKRQRARYEEEQKKLLYIHELERNKTENELVALRNAKLEAEIGFKNSELASSAMHLVKKGELIAKMKAELGHVMKSIDKPQTATELKKMIKALSDEDNMDQEWENFTKHFDKVHSDFVVSLKEKHPAITPNEVKLCAYLRMNLSTKEMAQLMNISVRGVEISRYRLRKKLGIASETSLFDYLMKI
jgi:ligand-binding sensor domain-containing protein/DNA-binding CsgD family transcriptional regulator